jgi:hypothetical protein
MRTVLIILAIVAGLVVVLFLGCAGTGYVLWRSFRPLYVAGQQMVQDIQATKALGHTFLTEIRNGKLDAAYELTSPGFKERMSKEAFEAFVEKHASLKQPLSLRQDQQNPMPAADSKKGTHNFDICQPTGLGREFVLKLVKENGVWMIDSLEPSESAKSKDPEK